MKSSHATICPNNMVFNQEAMVNQTVLLNLGILTMIKCVNKLLRGKVN